VQPAGDGSVNARMDNTPSAYAATFRMNPAMNMERTRPASLLLDFFSRRYLMFLLSGGSCCVSCSASS